MKAIDIVKEPRNNYDVFKQWQNWMQSALLSNFGKKIEVKYIPKIECNGSICKRKGEHSWFNHSMDGMVGSLPETGAPRGF